MSLIQEPWILCVTLCIYHENSSHSQQVTQIQFYHPGSLFSHLSCRHGWPNQFLLKIPYILQRNTKWWSITLDQSKFQMAQETIVQPKIKIIPSFIYPQFVPHLYDLLLLWNSKQYIFHFLCPFNKSLWGMVPCRLININKMIKNWQKWSNIDWNIVKKCWNIYILATSTLNWLFLFRPYHTVWSIAFLSVLGTDITSHVASLSTSHCPQGMDEAKRPF